MSEPDDEMFVWIPNKGVGPVMFGDDIKQHLGELPIRMGIDLLGNPDPEYYTHGDEEEPSYYVDVNDRVENIICYYALLYEGDDLLGLKLNEVTEILGTEPDESEVPEEMLDGEIQTIAEFDGLGLQLWFRNGLSNSAVVSIADDLLPPEAD